MFDMPPFVPKAVGGILTILVVAEYLQVNIEFNRGVKFSSSLPVKRIL